MRADEVAKAAALVFTVVLHLAAGWALASVSAPTPRLKAEEVQVSVDLVQSPVEIPQPEQPKVVQDEPQLRPVKKVKVAKKVERVVKVSKRGVKKMPEEVPQQAEQEIDCSMFDESTCNPCLDSPEVCKACCSKYQPKEAHPTTPQVAEGPPCPDCRREDPCTPAALHKMAVSFCPRVRAAIYSTLGRMRVPGVGPDDYLASRIAVAVSVTGRLSLAAVLKPSGHAGFDSAVRKAVSSAPAVLPPSDISACVVSKGCVFTVTVGAKKVKKTKSVIDLKKPSSMDAPMAAPMDGPMAPPKAPGSMAPAEGGGK